MLRNYSKMHWRQGWPWGQLGSQQPLMHEPLWLPAVQAFPLVLRVQDWVSTLRSVVGWHWSALHAQVVTDLDRVPDWEQSVGPAHGVQVMLSALHFPVGLGRVHAWVSVVVLFRQMLLEQVGVVMVRDWVPVVAQVFVPKSQSPQSEVVGAPQAPEGMGRVQNWLRVSSRMMQVLFSQVGVRYVRVRVPFDVQVDSNTQSDSMGSLGSPHSEFWEHSVQFWRVSLQMPSGQVVP